MAKNNTESLKSYIQSLCEYMKKNGYVDKPIPKIRLVHIVQDDNPFKAQTGHFVPDDNEIVLYVTNRHPKDILRTLAHELIHVKQHHEGRLLNLDYDNPLRDNPVLRSIEGEAFLLGNLALRDWTESKENS